MLFAAVVPLFETLDDLTNAPQTIDTLLGSEWYRNHIQIHHGGVQEVMIGEGMLWQQQ
jgi:phosphoenolpyruvate carboxylase